MAERRTGAWVWPVVGVCALVSLVVGIWAMVIADEWGDRFTAGYVIAVGIAGLLAARRRSTGSRSG